MDTVALKAFRQGLTEVAGRVQHGGERVVVSSHGRPAFAVVPVEDLEALERLEDIIDLEDARKARRGGGANIPLAEVRKRLGL